MKDSSLDKLLYVIKKLKFLPNKKKGQNFLINNKIIDYIINLLPNDKSNIIEIGPGTGILTQVFLEHGHVVYAVENDVKLFEYLNSILKKKYKNKFFLLKEDAVNYPIAEYIPNKNNYIIISNLPYNISTPWMSNLLKINFLPQKIIVFLQKETATKFISSHGSKNFSPISILIQSAFKIENIKEIPKNYFFPMPQVDSNLLELTLLKNHYIFKNENFIFFLRKIFTQKRKQIFSIIKNFNLPKIFYTWLLNSNIDNNNRPSDIAIKKWQELDHLLNEF